MAADHNENLLEVDKELLDELHYLIEGHNDAELRTLLIDLHAADIAKLLEYLPEEQRHYILNLLQDGIVGEAMLHLPDEQRVEFLAELEPEHISRIVEDLSTDDATDVVSELPQEIAEEVLQTLQLTDQEATEEIRELLRYEEDTAGGRMTTDYVAVGEHETVAASIEKIREFVRETELDVFVLYVVDESYRLSGIARLQDLVLYSSEAIVGRFMQREVITVTPDEDQELVAQVMQRYDLIAVPVVTEDNRLLGIVTFDDIADIIEDEASEDMLYMAGVTDDESPTTPPLISIRRRLPWLIMNLGTAFIASLVVAQFEETIGKVTVLAALMPIVAGMGGNAAVQSITVMVRSLALGDLGSGGKSRAIIKELIIGLMNGLVMGIMTGFVVWIMWHNLPLSALIAIAMFTNLMIAGVVGALIPLLLKKLNFDPALSSGPIATTFTDVCGFLTFLGLATLSLAWILSG